MTSLIATVPASLPATGRPGSVPDASALSFLAALAGVTPGPLSPTMVMPTTAALPAGAAKAGPANSVVPGGATVGLADLFAAAVPLGRCAGPGSANRPVHGGTGTPATDLPAAAILASTPASPFSAGGAPAVPGLSGPPPPKPIGPASAEAPASPQTDPLAALTTAGDPAPPAADLSGLPVAVTNGTSPVAAAASVPALAAGVSEAAAVAPTAPRPVPTRSPTGTAHVPAGALPRTGKDDGDRAVEPGNLASAAHTRTVGVGEARPGPPSGGGELVTGGEAIAAPEIAPACNADGPSPETQLPRDTGQQVPALPALPAPTGPADAAPTAPPSTSRPTVPLLANEVVRAVGRGDDRLTVELQPAELGRVQVALSFDGDGRLRAEFAVDRPDTLQLLQRDAQALEESLGGGGLQLADAGLSFSLRRERDGADPQRAAALEDGGPSQTAATREPEAVRRRTATDRLLDLHV